MRVVLTGGGSAGHLIPLGPIIEALRQRWAGPEKLELYFVGADAGGAREFLSKYDVPVYRVPAGKIRRYWSAKTITDAVVKLPLGVLVALWRLFWLMPEVVVSKGGYGSVPVLLAAWFYRTPILLHGSDVVPGLATRLGSYLATAIAVGFDSTNENWTKRHRKKIFVTGVPVRRELEHFNATESRKILSIPPQEKVLLVLGGSQGAQAINEALLKILPALVSDMTVLHVTGAQHFAVLRALTDEMLMSSSRRAAYRIYPYLEAELGPALAAADMVVSRAGATILAELARLRKVALLIPLPVPPAASDHQRRNAQRFERYGAARVLEPANTTPTLLEQNIRDLMTDVSMRQQLQQGMAAMDRPTAAAAVAKLVFSLAGRMTPTG